MSRLLRPTVVLLAATILLTNPFRPHAQQPPPNWYCEVSYSGTNYNRNVYGAVNTECTYSHWWEGDTHMWSGWCVASNFGPCYSDNQWRGWKTYSEYCSETLDPPQWNSCTSGSIPGNCGHFNWPNGQCTEQYSADEYYYGQLVYDLPVSEPYWNGNGYTGGCQDVNGATSEFNNSYMDLYDTDGLNLNDYETTLSLPPMSITLSCPEYDFCNTTMSGPYTPASNSIATGQVHLHADGILVYR